MLSSFLNGNQAASHAANESGEDTGLFQKARTFPVLPFLGSLAREGHRPLHGGRNGALEPDEPDFRSIEATNAQRTLFPVSQVSQNFDDGEDIDEQGVQAAHEQAYGQGNASNLGAKSMGAAAAMQALKKFTQGGGSTSSGAGGGGNQQSALIGMGTFPLSSSYSVCTLAAVTPGEKGSRKFH